MRRDRQSTGERYVHPLAGAGRRQARRRRGKSDATDAEAAARAALNGEARGVPKAGTGPVESLRALRVLARCSLLRKVVGSNGSADEMRIRIPQSHVSRHLDSESDPRRPSTASIRDSSTLLGSF
jgi:transposase